MVSKRGFQFEETTFQPRWNVGWGNGPRNRSNRLLETGSLGNIHLWVFIKDCMYLYWYMEASKGLNGPAFHHGRSVCVYVDRSVVYKRVAVRTAEFGDGYHSVMR